MRQLQTRKVTPSLLTGKLFDASGERMAPSHANKKGRRYRYYVSYNLKSGLAEQNQRGWRVPAQEIEHTIIQAVCSILSEKGAVTAVLTEAGFTAEQIPGALNIINAACGETNNDTIAQLIDKVDLRQDGMSIKLSLALLLSAPITISRDIPMQMKRRGVEMRLIIGDTSSPKIDATLIKTIARARIWVDELISGKEKSVATIAAHAGVSEIYISKLLPAAFLAPGIVNAIIEGKYPVDITSDTLTKQTRLPLAWSEQERILGFH